VRTNPISAIEFIKIHKDRVSLIGLGLAFLVFIGGGIYLQKANEKEKEPLAVVSPLSIELKSAQKEKGQGTTESTAPHTSYFLKPSPAELLDQLASMENLNDAVIDAKFSHLPVLWPAYFFTLQETEDGGTRMLLDVSEDGFGVVLESEVDLSVYPQLQDLAGGEKLWIGGEILAVDRAGTGTIYLKTDQLRFGEDPPFSPRLQETPQ
jgi:hypothetical protein